MTTGRGTGVAEDVWVRKVEAVRQALAVNRPDAGDALGVLAAVGGLEIAGLVGVVLAGAARRVPVVLDGFIATAAALVAARLAPAAREYLIAAHRSAEPGHPRLLEALGLTPYLELGMRLGEGTGAALGIGLLRSALACYREMATFSGSRRVGAASVTGASSARAGGLLVARGRADARAARAAPVSARERARPAAGEVTDMLGRRVRIPDHAARIVSLAPSITETVFVLGDGDRLVGVTDYCDYPAGGGPKAPRRRESPRRASRRSWRCGRIWSWPRRRATTRSTCSDSRRSGCPST